MDKSKHYAGRYICQRDRDSCKGLWHKAPCPLKDRCEGKGQLEQFWPMGRYGKLLIQSEPDWTMNHLKRRRAAEYAFARDAMRAYYADYREKNWHKLRANARRREELRKAAQPPPEDPLEGHGSEATGYGAGARHLLLPCGEDCERCPLPEGPAGCPFTDEDEDRLTALEYNK